MSTPSLMSFGLFLHLLGTIIHQFRRVYIWRGSFPDIFMCAATLLTFRSLLLFHCQMRMLYFLFCFSCFFLCGLPLSSHGSTRIASSIIWPTLHTHLKKEEQKSLSLLTLLRLSICLIKQPRRESSEFLHWSSYIPNSLKEPELPTWLRVEYSPHRFTDLFY